MYVRDLKPGIIARSTLRYDKERVFFIVSVKCRNNLFHDVVILDMYGIITRVCMQSNVGLYTYSFKVIL